MAKNVLFFVPELEYGVNSIFCSQVMAQVQFLKANGTNCLIVGTKKPKSVIPAGDSVGKNDIVFFNHPENGGFARLAICSFEAARNSISKIKDFRPNYIYTRSIFGSWAAKKLIKETGSKLIYDVRGLAGEEAAFACGKKNVVHNIIEQFEISQIRSADLVTAVSHPMAEWVFEKTRKKCKEVIPCCVNENAFLTYKDERSILRRELGWTSKDLVIVYCGGASAWQRIGDIFKYVILLQNKINNLKLFCISKDIKLINQIAKDYGMEMSKFRSKSIESHDVPKWLQIGDVGIIMRHDVLINRVSSPIKVAEYLASGLPVLCTTGVGEFSSLIKQHKAGFIIGDKNINEMERCANFIKGLEISKECTENAKGLAETRFTWSSNYEAFQRLYS